MSAPLNAPVSKMLPFTQIREGNMIYCSPPPAVANPDVWMGVVGEGEREIYCGRIMRYISNLYLICLLKARWSDRLEDRDSYDVM